MISAYKAKRNTGENRTYEPPSRPAGSTDNSIVLNYFDLINKVGAQKQKDNFQKAAYQYFSSIDKSVIDDTIRSDFSNISQRITSITIEHAAIVVKIEPEQPERVVPQKSKPSIKDTVKQIFYK